MSQLRQMSVLTGLTAIVAGAFLIYGAESLFGIQTISGAFLLNLGLLSLFLGRKKPELFVKPLEFWHSFARGVSRVMTPLVLFITYVAVVVPTKILKVTLGVIFKKVWERNVSRNETYWIESAGNNSSMEDQF